MPKNNKKDIDMPKKTNDGKAYEVFVQKIQQALIDAEPYAKQKNIIVEHNKILRDRCNCDRQFDIYWEYEMGGYTYKNVIECKDYENGVSIEKIDALIGKLHDLPGIHAIIATRVRFQEGAQKKAEANNIEIIIVRGEDEQKDWISPDGTPILKVLDIHLNALMPIVINKFTPIFDLEWAKEHGITNISINAADNEILLENKDTGETQSLYDYFNAIPRNKTTITLVKTHKQDFKNLFLCSNGIRLKVKSIEVDYTAPTLEERTIRIAPEVKGVVEYLNKKRKTIILQDQAKGTLRTVTVKTS